MRRTLIGSPDDRRGRGLAALARAGVIPGAVPRSGGYELEGLAAEACHHVQQPASPPVRQVLTSPTISSIAFLVVTRARQSAPHQHGRDVRTDITTWTTGCRPAPQPAIPGSRVISDRGSPRSRHASLRDRPVDPMRLKARGFCLRGWCRADTASVPPGVRSQPAAPACAPRLLDWTRHDSPAQECWLSTEPVAARWLLVGSSRRHVRVRRTRSSVRGGAGHVSR